MEKTNLCKQIYIAPDQISDSDSDLKIIFISFEDESFIEDLKKEIDKLSKDIKIYENIVYINIPSKSVDKLLNKIKQFNNATFQCECGNFEYIDNDYQDTNGNYCCEDCKVVYPSCF